MLTQALTFPKSLVDHRAGKRVLPRMLTHTVTFACNARCIMCDSWKKDATGDLELDEIERIYKQLPRLDALRLTGGEPFVRQDFAEIVRLGQLTVKPLVTHITTNAFLTDRIVKFCEGRNKSTALHMLISLDGTKDTHNRVRGRSFAFDSATETLRQLASRAKELNLRLAVNQTLVDREGIEGYRSLRALLQPLGVQHNLVVAYEKSATYDVNPEAMHAPEDEGSFDTFGDLEKSELAAFFDEVERDLQHATLSHRMAKKYYLKGIRNRLLHDVGKPNPPCAALGLHMRMFPNGDVPTCQFNAKVVGNLRKQSFEEVWASELATRQHAWVRACPGCWAECEILPSATYSGDLFWQSFVNHED